MGLVGTTRTGMSVTRFFSLSAHYRSLFMSVLTKGRYKLICSISGFGNTYLGLQALSLHKSNVTTSGMIELLCLSCHPSITPEPVVVYSIVMPLTRGN